MCSCTLKWLGVSNSEGAQLEQMAFLQFIFLLVHIFMQLGGSVVDSYNLGPELKKRVTHIFSTLRSRSLEYREDLVKQV